MEFRRGFTLIELVVVMAILGVLIAAVFALLSPIEQIHKASDASKQSYTREFTVAFARYYVNKNSMPWNATPAIPDCNPPETANQNTFLVTGTAATNIIDCIQELVAARELTNSFLDSQDLSSLLVSDESPTDPGNSKVTVCFRPESQSLRKNTSTTYTGTGYKKSSGCETHGGSDECYWCIR